MQKLTCPICDKELSVEEYDGYKDYHCRSRFDHHYGVRIKDDEILKVKVRLTDEDGSCIFFKINYDEKVTQVWTLMNQVNRVAVPHIFEPDFTDLSKLKLKMKTYLLFS